MQGVTKRCRLSWLTNSALVCEPKCGGEGGCCGVSANDYSCAHGAQINFKVLTPYLTYGIQQRSTFFKNHRTLFFFEEEKITFDFSPVETGHEKQTIYFKFSQNRFSVKLLHPMILHKYTDCTVYTVFIKQHRLYIIRNKMSVVHVRTTCSYFILIM